MTFRWSIFWVFGLGFRRLDFLGDFEVSLNKHRSEIISGYNIFRSLESLNVGLMVCSSLGWNIERQKKKASRYCAYNEAAEYFHIILSDMKSDDRIKL
ncbi:unnamed protein product [Rhizophagus irregularis]|nr:unnamed protein product [Rhizophagus irregularis]